jgi:hypothetical protein
MVKNYGDDVGSIDDEMGLGLFFFQVGIYKRIKYLISQISQGR